MRERVGPDFIIIYRLSMLDLVKDGSTWEEIIEVWRHSRRDSRMNAPA
jgi:2,4-dienoyl-CoA reductase (NADPH2)